MPFDTTYHIYTTEKNTATNYIVPGVKDTDIYLGPGEAPPGLSSLDSLYTILSQAEKLAQPGQLKKEEHYIPGDTMIIVFVAIFIFILIRVKKNVKEEVEAEESGSNTFSSSPVKRYNKNIPPYLTYYGETLNFTEVELITILNKRFSYYRLLPQVQKRKFTERLQIFIADKIFKIHDTKGYKEMPVLISAAAIQLTFGLDKYVLPNFKYIHVYPEEFLGFHPSIRVLEGNVSGHVINLSWKHFLQGYEDTTDGQNVGLHELSHALYYQTFVVEENVDRNFRDTFDDFNNYGNKVFHQESQPGNDLYSEYALKNFQEFWAESVEIFFEKPLQLKNNYPELYAALVDVLNQDPANITPLM
jgi:MtfA peptidase